MSDPGQKQLDEGWNRLSRWLEKRSGLVFSEGRRRSAETLATQVIQSQGIADFDDLMARANSDENLFNTLVAALTIGETYFFRDENQFNLIQDSLIPEIRSHGGEGRTLRLWSAGCSTGEEAYSLAVLLVEMGLDRCSEIVGTDLSQDSIAFARKGVYRSWSFRTEESARVRKYVHPIADDEEQFEIDSSLRRGISFRVRNLVPEDTHRKQHPLYPMDIVMCRNVLIYLSDAAIQQVATELFASLRPGGYLLTGPSDPMLSCPAEVLTKKISGIRIYRKSLRIVPSKESSESTDTSIVASKHRKLPVERLGNQFDSSKTFRGSARRTDAFRLVDRKEPSERVFDHGRVEEDRVLQEIVKVSNHSAKIGMERCLRELKHRPFCPKLNYLYGVLLMHEGRYHDSQVALRRALYLEPTLTIASYALANLLILQGDHSGAERCLRNIVDDSSHASSDTLGQTFECKSIQDLVQIAREQLEFILKKGLSE